MPRIRPPYPPEFRAEAVELARSSEKLLSELARDLGVSAESLRNWYFFYKKATKPRECGRGW